MASNTDIEALLKAYARQIRESDGSAKTTGEAIIQRVSYLEQNIERLREKVDGQAEITGRFFIGNLEEKLKLAQAEADAKAKALADHRAWITGIVLKVTGSVLFIALSALATWYVKGR